MNEWIEKYEDLHSAEGYRFIASSAIYFPYYVFTIVCHCLEYQPMTPLDIVVFKCIKQGIDNVEELSFVLSLNREIVQELLSHMKSIGILSLLEDRYKLTNNGNKLFQKREKQEITEQSFKICVNAITGEIESDVPSFFSDAISEESIKMEVDVVPSKKQIEESEVLKKTIEEMTFAEILNIKVQESKTLSYVERYILFYSNQKGTIKFDIYDLELEEFDLKISTELLKKYQRKKLYSLMKIEKLIKTENHLIEQYERKMQFRYCRNREIRELFKNVFQIAKLSILIVSPWIDNQEFVVTKELQNKMELCLSTKGLKLIIGYGYLPKETMQKRMQEYYEGRRACDKDINTVLMAKKLQKKFQQYSNFQMIYIGTHEKILSYDEQYTIIGSFNYLSYDGGENCGYQGKRFRFEGGVLINDREFAQYVEKKILEK